MAIGGDETGNGTALEVLGDGLDLKDAETEKHSKRVAAYTIAILKQQRLFIAIMKTTTAQATPGT